MPFARSKHLNAITLPSCNSAKPIAALLSLYLVSRLCPRRSSTSQASSTFLQHQTSRRSTKFLVPSSAAAGTFSPLGDRGANCQTAGRRTRTSLPRSPGARKHELLQPLQPRLPVPWQKSPAIFPCTCKPKSANSPQTLPPDAVFYHATQAEPGIWRHIASASRVPALVSTVLSVWQVNTSAAWRWQSEWEVVRKSCANGW